MLAICFLLVTCTYFDYILHLKLAFLIYKTNIYLHFEYAYLSSRRLI